MMDFTISIVKVSEEDYQRYATAIRNSDLDREIKFELMDLLQTARTQTEEVTSMGWI